MTDTSDAARTSNLLGAFALIAGERVQSASDRGSGRSATETAALVLLATTLDGTSQEGLARSLALTQSGNTRLVDRLVRDGLVQRNPGPDRRTFAISITSAGRHAARSAQNERAAACATFLEVLDEPESRAFARLLERILQTLPSSRTDAHRICRLCDPIACEHPQGRCPVTRGVDTLTDSRHR